MRIHSVRLYGLPAFDNLRVSLVANTITEKANTNHITILIGPNGTGKSTVLGEVARIIRDRKAPSKNAIVVAGSVGRLLGISTGISDKFPLPRERFSNRLHALAQTLITNHSASSDTTTYVYLGARTGAKTSNTNRICERLFEHIASHWVQTPATDHLVLAFAACGFRPEMFFHLKLLDHPLIQERAKSDGKISTRDILNILRKALPENKQSRLEMLLRDERLVALLTEQINSRQFHPKASGDAQLQADFRNHISVQKFFQEQLPTLLLMRDIGLLEIAQISVVKQNSLDAFDILSAGSGELKRFLILFSIAALAIDDTAILVDEPELSMHPTWQADMIGVMREILAKRKGCHVIIATHCPYLVSFLKDDDSTIVLMKDRDAVTHSGATFGWSVEKILLDIFGVATVRNRYFQDRIATLLRSLTPVTEEQHATNHALVRQALTDLSPFIQDQSDPLFHLITEVRAMLESNR